MLVKVHGRDANRRRLRVRGRWNSALSAHYVWWFLLCDVSDERCRPSTHIIYALFSGTRLHR